MRRVFSLVIRRPGLVLVLLALISAAAALGAGKLEIAVSAEGFMSAADPERAFYDETRRVFGSDTITVVYVSDPRLMEPDRLEALRSAAEALERLDVVSKVESLFTAKNFRDRAGILETRPFLDPLPQKPEAVAAVLADAHRNPMVERNLISTDGRTMAINVYLKTGNRGRDFDVRAAREIEDILAPLQGRFEKVFQIGPSYARKVLSEAIVSDQKILTPLAVGVILLSLYLSLGSLEGAMIPLGTAALSVLWTAGFMGFMGLPVTLLTAAVPALLIVIGSAEDMHMLAEYRRGLAEGLGRDGAIMGMAEKSGVALQFTFWTTYLGFLAVGLNDMPVLREFAVVSSTGLLFNFIATLLMAPLYLRLFGRREAAAGHAGSASRLEGAALGIWTAIAPRRRLVLVLTAAATVAVAAGSFHVKVDNNVLSYFKKDSDVRSRTEVLARSLSGMNTFQIVLTGPPGTFRDPEFLRHLRGLQDSLAGTGLFDSSISYADFIALIHREMGQGESAPLGIPKSPELVEQYRTLFLARSEIERYVSFHQDSAAVLVRHHISASSDLEHALERVRGFAHNLDRRLEVRITGEDVLTSRAVDALARGQASSLAALIIVIFLMMSTLFLNWKAGLLSLIPNLVPLAALFGLMGYLGIPLDIGTALIADVVIGIAVDDTIHMMVRYNQEMRRTGDEAAALADTLRAQAEPVGVTTLALILGFGVLLASSFVPVMTFGALSAVLLVIGLASDLLVTPTLLSMTRFVTLWDVLGVKIGRKVLEECELFRGLRSWQVRKLVSLCQVRSCAAAQTLVGQGEKGSEMFVVLSGSVRGEKTLPDGRRLALGSFGPGALLGELSLAAGVPRTADLVAEGPSEILVLGWRDVEGLSRALPWISSRIFLNMARVLANRVLKKEE